MLIDVVSDGETCSLPGDCTSGVCTTNICRPLTCVDMIKNGDETDEDCGGSCGACALTKTCSSSGDCTSGVCTTNICRPLTCVDTIKNGDETDDDCGGSCGPCIDGSECSQNSDCSAFSACQLSICKGKAAMWCAFACYFLLVLSKYA